ncbi:spore germination protein GerW family protein [Streptosporangium sp. NPDC051022]|uniref:GerW family sporulation protein n=1 Tax=Streptosporangium sp. NPDC051022 TaxID=3155752 RepID=UPI00343E4213
MNVMEMIDQARDAASVKRVFGEPIVRGDVTVIPVARVSGGAGAGSGRQEGGQPSENTGGGFGLGVTPAGVFVIKDSEVRWQPVIDVNRVILGGQLVAVAAFLMTRAVVRLRAKTAGCR